MKKYLVETEDYGTIGVNVSCDDYCCLDFDNVRSWKEIKKDPYEEVWDFVRLIYNDPEKGGMVLDAVIDCFGAEWPNIVNKYTYEEAKKCYDEWKEKKDKELNVGDEITYCGKGACVITGMTNDWVFSVKISDGTLHTFPKKKKKKTGKHYPEIAKLFSK